MENELAAEVLGNIAVESQERQDYVLNQGAMPLLLAQLSGNSTMEMLRAASATLLAFCRACPYPVEHTNAAIPVLGNLLSLNHCDDALMRATICLSNLSTGSNPETIQRISNSIMISRLIILFGHSSALIQSAALRTIFNIVVALDTQHTQAVIDNGVLPGLFTLLTNSEDNEVKQRICQIVFNITVLNRSCVIDSGIMEHVIHLLHLDDIVIKTSVVQTISTVTSERNHDHIRLLVSQGCIERLCNVLEHAERDIVLAAFKALEDILEVGKMETNGGEGDFMYKTTFMEASGLEKMDDAVLFHDDDYINSKYDNIIMGYFKDC